MLIQYIRVYGIGLEMHGLVGKYFWNRLHHMWMYLTIFHFICYNAIGSKNQSLPNIYILHVIFQWRLLNKLILIITQFSKCALVIFYLYR